MSKLSSILPKNSGRAHGSVTVRHQGGRQKRFLREIDFKREKLDLSGRVEQIEYDPNRNVQIARIIYVDGERRYILAPVGLKVDQNILSGEAAAVEPGNSLPLSKIPVGTQIHNIEIRPGKGGQMVKGAGSVAYLHGKEENYILVRLPSGEIRRFDPKAYATVGQLGNVEYKARNFRKAGTKRHMGIRPTVRGVAMHPNAHPHGGGEGRSHVGMKHPKTVYGRSAVGKTRPKGKYSNHLIIQGRKVGKHGLAGQ